MSAESSTEEFGSQFVLSYSQLVSAVWRDDAELARLLADPTGYATEVGLPVSPDAVVQVDRTQPDGMFTKDQIITAWTRTPGVHVLHVPEIPLIDLDELSEAELDAVSAGKAAEADNINIIAVLFI